MTGLDEEIESLKERGWRQVSAIDAALDRGEIDEAGWFRAVGDLLVPAYLSGGDARAQSGYLGDERRWEGARRLLLDAVDRSGSFLDVGCANGHLMECVRTWALEDGIDLEPWGLDISAELAALARERLPQWSERIFVGNAIDWRPKGRFDFVRTCLDYVPVRRRPELLHRVLADIVAPGGRLIVGVFTEEAERETLREAVEAWGFVIAGRTDRPHPDSDRVVRRAFWIDARG